MLAGRDKLLGTRRFTEIETEAGKIGIIELSGKEREHVLRSMFVKDETADVPEGLQFKIVRWCVVDDDRKPIFKVDDDDAIANIGGALVEQIVLAVLDLSGITEKGQEGLQKNSESDPSGDVGSGSRKRLAAA